MDIEYIYAADNNHHRHLRRRIAQHCHERGILTRITDREAPVSEPVVIVDGYQVICHVNGHNDNGNGRPRLPREVAELIDWRAWIS